MTSRTNGRLRNGAPFQDRDLPPAMARLSRKLGARDEADRRFVRVLAAVLVGGTGTGRTHLAIAITANHQALVQCGEHSGIRF